MSVIVFTCIPAVCTGIPETGRSRKRLSALKLEMNGTLQPDCTFKPPARQRDTCQILLINTDIQRNFIRDDAEMIHMLTGAAVPDGISINVFHRQTLDRILIAICGCHIQRITLFPSLGISFLLKFAFLKRQKNYAAI